LRISNPVGYEHDRAHGQDIFCAYLLLALGPLTILSFSDELPSRGFWIEFSAALGFIALAMLGHVRLVKPLRMKRRPYRIVDR
jgi:hypothetical protein